jgi:hypothetical protein
MRFLKYFKQLFEGLFDLNKINDWEISYNDNNKHSLEKRIKERTYLDENSLNLLLNKIVLICEKEKLDETWIFISFKFSCKIVIDITKFNKSVYIVTFLGKDESMKETKNIRII